MRIGSVGGGGHVSCVSTASATVRSEWEGGFDKNKGLPVSLICGGQMWRAHSTSTVVGCNSMSARPQSLWQNKPSTVTIFGLPSITHTSFGIPPDVAQQQEQKI